MIEIKAPNKVPRNRKLRVFLAGSIEMGKAENWQTKFVKTFKDEDIIIINPRRDDWDSSWEQSADNPEFSEQVNWELENIEGANIVVFYFDPATMSPITLMELGLCNERGSFFDDFETPSAVVCCPKGFWRKGNVDVLCQREGIPVVETFEDFTSKFREILGKWQKEMESWEYED